MTLASIVNGAIRERLDGTKAAPRSYTDIAGGFRMMLQPAGVVLFHKEHPQQCAVIGDVVWSPLLGNIWALRLNWREKVAELVRALEIEVEDTADVPF